jgi:hypothetical protein
MRRGVLEGWGQVTLAVLLGAVGCRQMLDLEQARVEPDAQQANGGDASDLAGTSAQGGMQAGSGNSGGSIDPGNGGGGEPQLNGAQGGNLGEGGSPDLVAAGSAGAPAPLSLCESYCDALTANCTGNLVQFSDYETCIDTCETLPPGAEGDTEVNTVHCRLAEAEKAGRLEPDFYCPLAGPASSGKCGSSCEAFCTIMASFCTAESTSGLYYYADQETCLSECALWPLADVPYSAALHSIGPHFECRLFHACASNIDADYHCGHAFGDPPCNPE